MYLINRLLEF